MLSELDNPGLKEHLDELKHRMKWVVIAFFASLVIWLIWPAGDFNLDTLFSGLYQPLVSVVLDAAAGLGAGKVTIIAGSLSAPLQIYFYASAAMALITTSPVIAYETYKFVDPALYPSEKRVFYRFMVAFLGLFAAGATIAWFVLMPAIIRFMVYFNGVANAEPVVTAGDYYGMVLMAVAATAIAFTTPAIFLLLVNFGIVSTNALAKNRLWIYAGLYLVIATLTVEPMVGHLGMFFPIVGMLEVSILIGRRMERKRVKSEVSQVLSTRTGVCRFCEKNLGPQKTFCPECGRAQA
jgi:sec-independent protein translocase protein TatC